jgi:Tfp pilus assembly protein PilZ
LSDKRAHERHAIELAIQLECAGVLSEGVSRDLGPGGMFVHTQAELPFAADVRVRFKLPRLEEPTQLEATVRWHSPEGVGLQFRSPLRAREVWALAELARTAR